MKHLAALPVLALSLTLFSACKSDRKDPLVGTWKLTAVSTTPTAAGPQEPPAGTIFSFRPDSTLRIGTASYGRYELQRLPEGMFLQVGDSPGVQYRIVAMTPAKLGLQQDRGERQLNLQLEYQP